ncbi:hypothetical protein D3C76_921160 [compost metagenome]
MGHCSSDIAPITHRADTNTDVDLVGHRVGKLVIQAQVDAQARVFPYQRFQKFDQIQLANGVWGRDADNAFSLLFAVGDKQLIHPVQGFLGLQGEFGTKSGDMNLPCAAVEQQLTQRTLQFLDGTCHRLR